MHKTNKQTNPIQINVLKEQSFLPKLNVARISLQLASNMIT